MIKIYHIKINLREFFKRKMYFMDISVWSACMFMYHAHVWCLRKTGDGIGSPGTETADGYRRTTMWGLGIEPQPSSGRAASAPEASLPSWCFPWETWFVLSSPVILIGCLSCRDQDLPKSSHQFSLCQQPEWSVPFLPDAQKPETRWCHLMPENFFT